MLYGSESEIDDSDDGGDQPSTRPDRASKALGKLRQRGPRLRLDDGEPMDLLYGAAEKLTGAYTSP